jgi:hypothetical protein
MAVSAVPPAGLAELDQLVESLTFSVKAVPQPSPIPRDTVSLTPPAIPSPAAPSAVPVPSESADSAE